MNKINIHFGSEILEIRNLQIPEDCDLSESISYEVWGMPECEFDQHVRARIGIKFERIENKNDNTYILYPSNKSYYDNNKEKIENFLQTASELNQIDDTFSVMSKHSPYKVTQTLESLIGQMNRRLMFCEEIFIVSLHWKLRHQLLNHPKSSEKFKKWILENCILSCDIAKKCVYAENDFLTNSFGILFSGCGRWEDFSKGNASFNHSCTTPEDIKKYLNIVPYRSNYEIENNLRTEE